MEIDPTKLYMMPLIMGAQYNKDPLPRISYPQSENVVVQYKTAYEAARELVPDCYFVDEDPTVTVVFGYHSGLEFLAGNGYALAAFQISARFNGEANQIEGDYIPALDGPPDADYPTVTRDDVKINNLWMGKEGRIYFGSPTESDIGLVMNVIEALKALEVVKIERALHFKGSAVLRFDQSHRLT